MALVAAAGCASPFLSVDDAVSFGEKPVVFVAYAERQQILGLRSDVEHVTVSFLAEGREIRRADTGGNGRAAVEFPLPHPEMSSFQVRAIVDGRELQTTGRIFAWQEDRPAIAVDIDKTISRTEYEDLILKGRDIESRPIPGSRESLSGLANDFHVTYVTARPRIFLEKTRWWLAHHEFPPGPVVTAPRIRDVIRYETVKKTMLGHLRRRWSNLLIGIGNSQLDADAYGASGMLALIVNPGSKRAYGLHAIVLGNWDEVDRFFAANRAILTRRDELSRAIRGEVMLRRCVIPWTNDQVD